MRFSFGPNTFRIWFQYSKHDGKRETICLIDRDDSNEKTFAAGSSVCAESDHFRKETGRKIALTRALRNARHLESIQDQGSITHMWIDHTPQPAREWRAAAWKAYLNRKSVDLKTASAAQTQTMPEAT